VDRKTTARWLIVSAFACFGFVLAVGTAQAQEGETTVQGSQNSFGSLAATGGTVGVNQSNFNGGPAANGVVTGSAQQLGSNRGTVSQSAEAKSGDPVAGGQVTGAVADNVTVQNQNTAIGSIAVSGGAVALNVNQGTVGPSATAVGPAQVSQVGNNSADIAQSTVVETGDAVAGSQVTGIVGRGEHTIQNSNTSLLGIAVSGAPIGISVNLANAGPLALSALIGQAGQVGDNDATLSQSSSVKSGDALGGSQVSGIVGGSATVQNQNSSVGGLFGLPNVALTSPVIAVNISAGGAGGIATGLIAAQASQTGDNTVDAVQQLEAETGDAVAGSQVTGAVGDQGGFLVVQNQQASLGDIAISGDVAVAINVSIIGGGPRAFAGGFANVSQNGSNDVAASQVTEVGSGDALAGSQVTGAVGHSDVTVQNSNIGIAGIALSGGVGTALPVVNVSVVASGPTALALGFASASQFGDNSAAVSKRLVAESGDAVAGGQVTGVVASGSTVTIANSNTGLGNIALSGAVAVINVDAVFVGPVAAALVAAQTSQTGDNTAAISTEVTAASGDAVAGSQVTGVVAGPGSDVTVMNQNIGILNFAVSGGTAVLNLSIGPRVGPTAAALGFATVSQMGDNSAAIATSVEASSGDAVAGSQVTGVVTGAGSDVRIQNSNTSLLNFAFSGGVTALNVSGFLVPVGVGPTAAALLFASASQTGDNALAFSQDLSVASGDAVAGSQVSGVVGVRNAQIQVQNSNLLSLGLSGGVAGLNIANGTTAATATAAFASASQTGDSAFDGSQALSTESGDSVVGSQINGEVGGGIAALGTLPGGNGA
jgi:hypothetical protein